MVPVWFALGVPVPPPVPVPVEETLPAEPIAVVQDSRERHPLGSTVAVGLVSGLVGGVLVGAAITPLDHARRAASAPLCWGGPCVITR